MKNSFLKSFITLSGSNLIAQVINLLTYIILPRYFYSPEEFGVFGIFLPFYFVLFEIVNLKMDQSIMLPKEEEEAKQLMQFSWITAIAFSIVICLLLWLASLLTISIDKHLLYFLGLSLLLGGLLQPMLVFLNRKRAYFKMGNIRVIQSIATLIISISAFYVFDNWVNGLVVGFIGGQVAALLVALFFIPFTWYNNIPKSLITKYNQFIKYGTISSMIGTLSRNLPAFAIKLFFGDAWLGHYTLATKFLNAPIGIFSNSIGQIYFKEASEASLERLKELTNSIIRNIAAITIIPAIILLLFSGGIFEFVFGSEWRLAGRIIQVFILWYLVAYITSPLSVLLDVKLKLKWELNYNLLLLVSRTIALSASLLISNIYVILAIYSFVGVIFNGYLLSYIKKLSSNSVE